MDTLQYLAGKVSIRQSLISYCLLIGLCQVIIASHSFRINVYRYFQSVYFWVTNVGTRVYNIFLAEAFNFQFSKSLKSKSGIIEVLEHPILDFPCLDLKKENKVL